MRLAKVAGILIAYPDIHVEVDGYTDNTGSPLLNERLSQGRAVSVQSYLTQQGVPASSIAIHGFGEANPSGWRSERPPPCARIGVSGAPTFSLPPLAQAVSSGIPCKTVL